MTCISLHLITTTVCSKRLVKLRKMRSRRKISLWWWWHTVNIESKKREKRNRELCIRILNFFFTPQQLGVRAGGQRSERVNVKSKIWKEWGGWKDMDSRAHSSFSLSVRNKGKEEWKKEGAAEWHKAWGRDKVIRGKRGIVRNQATQARILKINPSTHLIHRYDILSLSSSESVRAFRLCPRFKGLVSLLSC